MQIVGIENKSVHQIQFEVQSGARFIQYRYCLSALVVTFRQPTDIYLLQPGQNRFLRGLPWALLTFVCGWWGVPWGPIFTVQCLYTDLKGGNDLTAVIYSPITGNAWPPTP
jgi:hypothetical protein